MSDSDHSSIGDRFPVADLPFVDSMREVSEEDRVRMGLYASGGYANSYRVARMKGVGASRSENTWDAKAHEHTCCKSRVHWRHKVSCPKVQ